MKVGISPPVGSRRFRTAGGMAPSHLSPSSKPPSMRYLSLAEREEIAILQAQGHGVREVARLLGRAASTISRELRRNAATRSGSLDYRATMAQWHAERAARRLKPAKLAGNTALRIYVQDRLVAMTLANDDATESLIAFDEAGEAVAAAMLAGDAARRRAEAAIAIRADRKGLGIDWTLLAHLVGHARRCGYALIESIEDRANSAAIELEREMGFEVHPVDGEPALVRVKRRLR